MTPPNLFELKRGDTFSCACFIPEGVLYDGGTWTAKCDAVEKLSKARHSIAVRLVAPVPPETRYLLHLYASASDVQTWRLGKLLSDIEFIDTSAEPEPFKVSTSTFVINLKEDQTQ